MPMYQSFTIFVTAALLSCVTAAAVKRLRIDLLRPVFWPALFTAAATLSAASALFDKTRHAGTGLTTNYGWPKPFYFRYLSETGAQSDGWEFIYFFGNSLVYAGALLMLWTMWRIVTR
jgi:hypothetical protein